MTLKICNTIVDVKFLDPSIFSPEGMGRCHIKKGLIMIDETMPVSVRDQTLLHECVHYIGDCLGLELTEAQVSGLAVGIHGIIKDNDGFLQDNIKTKEKAK